MIKVYKYYLLIFIYLQQMSKSQFLEKANVNMLWDVIADEELFKNIFISNNIP